MEFYLVGFRLNKCMRNETEHHHLITELTSTCKHGSINLLSTEIKVWQAKASKFEAFFACGFDS